MEIGLKQIGQHLSIEVRGGIVERFRIADILEMEIENPIDQVLVLNDLQAPARFIEVMRVRKTQRWIRRVDERADWKVNRVEVHLL